MNRVEPFTPAEVCLYFYLLSKWNDSGREESFELGTRKMIGELKMTDKTIFKVRDTLIEKGLITYTEGERRSSSPTYRIIEKVEVSRQRKVVQVKAQQSAVYIDDIPIPPEYLIPEPPPEPEVSGEWGVEELSVEVLPEVKMKARGKKVKPLDELFKPEKPKSRGKREFIPPTLQEVEDYFIGKNVMDATLRAQQFFFHYDSLGWKTATGASVYRWDSLANKWLLNDKQKEKDGTKGRNGSKAKREGGDNYKQALYDRFAASERQFRAENGDSSDVW